MAAGTDHAHTNRLSAETSPYLLQHAHNPVDWHAWGPEAFAAARAQNKPIFLSVGYSTCYWCHVMERQSFENERVAGEMNARFINIKVDREERPDVDQLYMMAVQVLTRHGGWPMSVFLTPDLRPFYGGTYFPPTDQQGRPGFITLMKGIEDAYRNRPQDVEKTANQLVDILKQLAQPAPPDSAIAINAAFIDSQVARAISDYDAEHGGFGSAPKFPRQTLLELLLRYIDEDPNQPTSTAQGDTARFKEQVRRRLFHTLDALAAGGIRDHLGGGFHRYSTDAQWLVPHFEIMLYDNAMLAWIYVDAYRQSENRQYAAVARGILDFVLREMTSSSGAFYTALDAEVDAREGLSYLWTAEEVEALLGKTDARIFSKVYGLDEGPNFADPHHGPGHPDTNILYMPDTLEDIVEEISKIDVSIRSTDDLEKRLAAMRQTLYAARRKRKQPLLDTKILTSWNALMIRAFAHTGKILQEQKYIDAAARAADYLLRHHRKPDGGLYRASRPDPVRWAAVPGEEAHPSSAASTEAQLMDAKSTPPGFAPTQPQSGDVPGASVPGFLDDYAFVIQALLALDDAGQEKWRDHAAALAITLLAKFGDTDTGGFYFTEKGAADLIVRQKVASDSPLPSGNAIAAMALHDLGQPHEARNTIAVFAQQMEANGESMSAMVEAALHYVREQGEFQVAPSTSVAADRPLSPNQVAAGVVSLRAAWSNPTTLQVHVNVLQGFHINAHEASTNLIATQLAVTGRAAEEVAGIDYPPGEEQRFAFAAEPLRVYSGDVVMVVRFKSSRAGAGEVSLAISYQPCDDQACLPPVTKQLEVTTP